MWPIASLGYILAMAQEAMTAAARILEIFDTEPSIVVRRPGARAARAATCASRASASRFPDLPDELVLRDVHLEVAPGETVALVGATGSGKTVLTSLVPRLYDVTAGRVTIDGVDVRDLRPDHLRQVVATAFEEPTLFSMSARENLLLGRRRRHRRGRRRGRSRSPRPASSTTCPWGLDTRIGEQGMSLSGGQRQRLALARAVLARPRILVLDDTLSALDVHTEKLVEEALRRVLARRHRRSSSRTAPPRCCSPTRSRCSRTAPSPTSGGTASCWRPSPPTASCSRPTPTPTSRRPRHERRLDQPARRRPTSEAEAAAVPSRSRSGAGSPPSTATTTSPRTPRRCCRRARVGC